MKSKKTTKVRNKYSALCLKRAKLTYALVFVTEHNVWAIVKGKEYTDGRRFRYIYNGREAVAEPYKCIPVREGLTKSFLKSEAVRLNINLLQIKRPKKKKLKARWAPVPFDLIDDIVAEAIAPIVAEEQ